MCPCANRLLRRKSGNVGQEVEGEERRGETRKEVDDSLLLAADRSQRKLSENEFRALSPFYLS